MPVNLIKAVEVSKVIGIDVINKVRRLCFRGALSRALFLKMRFLKDNNSLKNVFF